MGWRARGTRRQPSSAKRSRFKPHRPVSPHAKASEQLGPLGAALGPRTCPQLSEDAAPGCSPTPPSHASVRPPHPGSDLLLSPDTREGDGHLALGPSPHFLRSLSPPRRPPQGCERTQCAGGGREARPASSGKEVPPKSLSAAQHNSSAITFLPGTQRTRCPQGFRKRVSERRASAEQRGTLRRPEPSPRACRLPGAVGRAAGSC